MSIARLDPLQVRHLVVHCSATPADRDLSVTDIDRMHRDRGFIKVGYHYVIKRAGYVQPGRALAERGAHVEGHNATSVGICLIGGVNSKLRPEANFTEAQYGSLQVLLLDLEQTFPNATVVGHRDLFAGKACPSFDVKKWWAAGGPHTGPV